MTDRFLASLFSGCAALMIALDCGLPLWRNLPIGDASDFGATIFFAVWFTLKAVGKERANG